MDSQTRLNSARNKFEPVPGKKFAGSFGFLQSDNFLLFLSSTVDNSPPLSDLSNYSSVPRGAYQGQGFNFKEPEGVYETNPSTKFDMATETNEGEQYRLRCTLLGHSMDVRAVATGITQGGKEFVVSGSRDRSTKIWMPS